MNEREPVAPINGIEHHLMLIGGEWQQSGSGAWIDVESPSSRQLLARVPRGSAVDVDNAVAAARQAFPAWADTSPATRARALTRVADAIEAEAKSLARLLASETGNALRTQARPEIQQAADVFRYFAAAAGEMKGVTAPVGPGLLNYTIREPHGVVAAVVPWNAPVTLSALKISMAISTGNTVVLKAAEDAPLAVLAMADICRQALPAGTVNVLTGFGDECGAALMRNPGVDKLTFTGSTAVGKSVMAVAAGRVVPVSLELGGKNPAVVFADSDQREVAKGVVAGMRFTRQGQSCTAGSRLLVEESVFDSFMGKVVDELEKLKVGNPLDEETDMGAIINERQYDCIRGYVSEAVSAGGRLMTGEVPGPVDRDSGFYVPPIVVAGVKPGWRVEREEVFGPVLVAIPWRTEEEALRMANDSHYGLAAFVWTHDISRAIRTAHSLDAGWIQINRGLGQLPGMTYGGFKESGLGAEFSIDAALDSYTRSKTVTVAI